jgi:HEPN domain-containing protein
MAGTPSDWLARAKSNLARASSPKPEGVLWEDLCFDAQQAAEKSLKAMLCSRGVEFRPVHDIGELIQTLAEAGIQVPDTVRNASELTVYAVQTRYPGEYERVTEEESAEALKTASAVVKWAEAFITGR